MEIQDAVEKCAHIQLVIAHIGNGMSHHAKTAIDELIADPTHGEDRRTHYKTAENRGNMCLSHMTLLLKIKHSMV